MYRTNDRANGYWKVLDTTLRVSQQECVEFCQQNYGGRVNGSVVPCSTPGVFAVWRRYLSNSGYEDCTARIVSMTGLDIQIVPGQVAFLAMLIAIVPMPLPGVPLAQQEIEQARANPAVPL